MRAVGATVVALALAVAAPLSAQTMAEEQSPTGPTRRQATGAQDPFLSVTAFALAAEQQFAATTTFNAIFGSTSAPFFGGGARVALRSGPYVELAASRFRKTGERAFLFNNQASRLGIPLTATIVPVEVTGGYRLHLRRYPRVVPFGGVGVGWYHYTEVSEFSDPTENVDTRHNGYLVVGGVELKALRWIAFSIDTQYTHVPDILGNGGISEDASEHDLGGTAIRFKVVVGR